MRYIQISQNTFSEISFYASQTLPNSLINQLPEVQHLSEKRQRSSLKPFVQEKYMKVWDTREKIFLWIKLLNASILPNNQYCR